ncbi:adenine-specific methyltransferase EcoRI family protein [Propionimicrobium sp. PCR01-08-3]|uniref:adenine-specific methyltransferase EcoRI family protein n=1 Tax=Propionimicrobium sp. PCR01-08-3 TaxID=3052086 RepID=UPI00255C73C8|nr:adenine-specific methyltransferase EcoRI family protein [Propionimicrobium sp. PCR01-08-3]WIY83934.1 adenine-specific methyltransferase EcoRI family protein [Propionimicrobium sp. PCR01-08-3]
MANKNLNSAKAAKFDEYYTVWADIEREINAYLEFDPDVFRGKTVLLPCDDPEWSNFTKFFALHFADFGLKKLISTSFAPNSNAGAAFYTPTLFETEGPGYDPDKSLERGRVFTLTGADVSGDGRVNIDDLHWEYLDGDGDFRSAEVTALRDEADFVITNPPFSLFRMFVGWLMEGDVRFSVVGNSNATTYVEIFPLIRENKVWKGATANATDMVFAVPKGTPLKEADRLKAQRLGYPSTDEHDFTRLGNSCWFTNIEHGRRHEPLTMLSMADNIKFSKHREIKGVGYERYYNFQEAIEVPFVDAIPSDHEGVMGVPITFLDKYNPDQFEILAHGDDMEALRLLGVDTLGQEFVNTYYAQGGTGGNSPGHRRLGLTKPTYHTAYKRILIRHRNPEPKKG